MVPDQKDKRLMKPREIKAYDGAGEGGQCHPGPEYYQDMKSIVPGRVNLKEMKAPARGGERKRERRGLEVLPLAQSLPWP